ncbi:MAG: MFS transporter [Solirubrobacteraceae bacterium]
MSTQPRPALRDPQFLRYLGGQAVSGLGDQVWYVALSWSAVRLSSPAGAATALTLSSLPRLTLMLFGGVIADRVDIRRLMIGSDAARTAITLIAVAIAITVPGIGLLVVIAIVYGVVDGVFMPAAGAMQPRLLDPSQYNNGAVAANLTTRLALSLGAPLGGVMVAVGGLPLALAVDAATFAVSVGTLATVRPRPLSADRAHTDEHAGVVGKRAAMFAADLIAGVRFLIGQPVLGPVTAITLLDNLGFVGPMNIGIAELSDHRGWEATGIGLMLAGFGAGAVTSSLIQMRWRIRNRAGVWIIALCTASGGALLALALAPSLGAAVATTALLGLFSGPLAVASSVLTQQHTPDELRGRVSSFNLLSSYGTVPLAMVGTGVAIASIGVTGTFAVCGAINAAALLFLLAPTFRRSAIRS